MWREDRDVGTSPRGALGPVDGGQENRAPPNYLAEDFSIRIVRETVQVYTQMPVLVSYLSYIIVFHVVELFSSVFKIYVFSIKSHSTGRHSDKNKNHQNFTT